MSLPFQRMAPHTKSIARLSKAMLGNRNLATAKLSRFSSLRSSGSNKRLAQVSGLGLGLAAAQYYLGSGTNYFNEEFVTTKRPEDLADFYGTEDFMEIFCVFPFMVKLMMRGAEFDDDGTIHAWGLLGPGELEISIDFDEEEKDTNGDGEPDTLIWFNKKEHFSDIAPSFLGGFTLWEMTQNFGYHRYDDGTSVVYHQGESFRGLFLIRLIFQLHAKYVIWATEKYINSDEFGSEDSDESLEEQRHNIPLHVFKGFLAGLTRDVERMKLERFSDIEKYKGLDKTLAELSKISSAMDEKKLNLPRLHTIRSAKTNFTRVHLLIDDQQTKDTIKTAMKQIGSSSGQRNGPAAEIRELVRRTTLSNEK